ncbi:MAG: HIT family protein [Kiritimatiellae bacterium]|nr:HIT family protein [Kiritimatiellia bacterium]
MSDCVFCKIINGEIPSCKVYEDDHVVAFLDLQPVEKGHTLVVPKFHVPLLTDLPEEKLRPVMTAVQKVARLLTAKLGCDGFNVMQNNGLCATQTVPHVHFHIIPRWGDAPKTTGMWAHTSYDSMDEMKAMCARLTSA